MCRTRLLPVDPASVTATYGTAAKQKHRTKGYCIVALGLRTLDRSTCLPIQLFEALPA